MIKNNKIITPKLTDSVLESITRDTVIKLALDAGLDVEERTIDRTELYVADEAFLCGSAMEITPVYSVDRYEITSEVGKITKMLKKNILMLQWVKTSFIKIGLRVFTIYKIIRRK